MKKEDVLLIIKKFKQEYNSYIKNKYIINIGTGRFSNNSEEYSIVLWLESNKFMHLLPDIYCDVNVVKRFSEICILPA